MFTCMPEVVPAFNGLASCLVNVGDCLSDSASVILATIGLLDTTSVILGSIFSMLLLVPLMVTPFDADDAAMMIVGGLLLTAALLLASWAAIWLMERDFCGDELTDMATGSSLMGIIAI